MSKVPAIQGSLVDARNIAVHKTLRLLVDVPVESAGRVLELFGWPTMANPIPVALAPLNPQAVQNNEPKTTTPQAAGGRARADALTPEQRSDIAVNAANVRWKGGKLSRAAAFLCQAGAFHRFLEEHAMGKASNADEAAKILRGECNIESRAELDHDPQAASRFREIKASYDAWMTLA